MTIFAVSDIHGHYSELRKALDNAGFNEKDPDHLLICCGDCFDRGNENLALLDFLSSLERKVLIRGNHEDILENIIEKQVIDQIDIFNGADVTAKEFFGEENIDRHGRIDLSDRSATVKKIKNFIGSMCDFYETENHIFTHAWLPTIKTENGVALCPDVRRAKHSEWMEARYSEWFSALEAGLVINGKKIVCGHRASRNASRLDHSRNPDDDSIYTSENAVVIDSATVRTKNVNVYVTNDTLFENLHHQMSLKKKAFERTRDGKKTVDIRLFDERRHSLSIGDIIEFRCSEEDLGILPRQVVGIYRYENLASLVKDFKAPELGFTLSEIELIDAYISEIYKKERIDKYGFIAIRHCKI